MCSCCYTSVADIADIGVLVGVKDGINQQLIRRKACHSVSQAVNLTLGQRNTLWEAGIVCELTELTAAELTLQLYGSG